MNGTNLAYLGDAYYELRIREYLIQKKITNANKLHQKAITFTSGIAQAEIVQYFIKSNILTEEEQLIYKKGRNGSSAVKKNIDGKTYQSASGFEAIIGALYFQDRNRADWLIDQAIKYCEEVRKHEQNNR
ncbi:MAG: ribonuclease III domain-containing protein [Acholeplasmataceae bacterium]